jgi:hypothetical protein
MKDSGTTIWLSSDMPHCRGREAYGAIRVMRGSAGWRGSHP